MVYRKLILLTHTVKQQTVHEIDELSITKKIHSRTTANANNRRECKVYKKNTIVTKMIGMFTVHIRAKLFESRCNRLRREIDLPMRRHFENIIC